MATTLSAAKGRLIRCTVPGSTPNCLAMTRTPGLPGVARASRIRFSSAGAIGAQAFSFPSGPGKPSTDPFRDHRTLKLGKHAHHLEHRLAGGRRGVESFRGHERITRGAPPESTKQQIR